MKQHCFKCGNFILVEDRICSKILTVGGLQSVLVTNISSVVSQNERRAEFTHTLLVAEESARMFLLRGYFSHL